MDWKDEISTPALLLHYEKMQKNLNQMANFAVQHDVNLRPHIKTHKCPIIGHMQLKAPGTNGICVAKVGEAEIFAQCGFDDILIANQVINKSQIHRLIKLNKWTLTRVCVDNPKNIKDLNDIAARYNQELELLIDVDLGMGRQGTSPGESTLELAKLIKKSSNLKLVGLQGYEGHLTPMTDDEQRKKQTEECMKDLVDTRDLLNENGFNIDYLSASGSGTYMFSADVEGITEIQPGTYILADEHIHRVVPEFEPAVTVLSTITNKTGKRQYTMDAGLKAVPTGDGNPIFKNFPKNRLRVITEEHAQFKASTKYDSLEIGQKVELVPAHICITVNLYDFYTVVKNGEVIAEWDIMARGKNY